MLLPVQAVHAQEATPYDLIDITNSLRVNYGNAPLAVSGALMASAQTTAEIMASSRSCGHIGDASGRAAAAGFGDGSTVFATENIACGTNMSAADIMSSYWSDALHMLSVTMSSYTHVGAGVARDADGFAYYVLHAAYSSNSPGVRPANPSQPGVQAPVSPADEPLQLIQAVQKAEPQPDGSIIHTVGYGQTLSGISSVYEVPLERLVELNPVIGPNMVIYDKQKLLIALAVPATATPEVSPTPEATATATPTPMPSATATQPEPTATLLPAGTVYPTATAAPAKASLGLTGNTRNVGLIVIAASVAGLGLMVYSTLMGRKKE